MGEVDGVFQENLCREEGHQVTRVFPGGENGTARHGYSHVDGVPCYSAVLCVSKAGTFAAPGCLVLAIGRAIRLMSPLALFSSRRLILGAMCPERWIL